MVQEKVPDKTNEITAFKMILEWLDLRGSIITIDAMGCQTDIAEKITNKEGDYILALKGNQSTLREDVEVFFEGEKSNKFTTYLFDHHRISEKGHGRIEIRNCWVCNEVDWLKKRHPKWTHLSGIICIKSERHIKKVKTSETRYYLTSLSSKADIVLNAVRSHWSIENSLHWILDMCFGDDQSRIRQGNSPLNMAILKHIALNLISEF